MWFDPSNYWYSSKFNILIYLLLPFTYFYRLIILIRYFLYRIALFKTHHFSVPVIVVGNITVGGTGKTPFVIWLANLLRAKGYRPGIVSRGVGGKKHREPYLVTSAVSSQIVGDEALLLAAHTSCPVMIAINRPSAVKKLLLESDCNIIISDDGLQHYALHRDIEIIIIDGMRQFGNRYLLPAGPLREPVTRLNKADFIIVNGQDMTFIYGELVLLSHPTQTKPVTVFSGQRVHAVAGIGNPERFFSALRKAGLNIIPHIFPDHYTYSRDDFNFENNNDLPIIMTEKDAVKCKNFSDGRYWYWPVTAKVNHEQELTEKLLAKLNSYAKV